MEVKVSLRMQRTAQFAKLSNPVKCSACVVSLKIAIECGIAFSEMRLFLENHLLELNEIWHENTLENK